MAVVAASGGKAVGLALVWESLPLWQVIELVEMVTELSKTNAPDDDLDLF